MTKSDNRNMLYSLGLALLILIDSVVTINIGGEMNPLLLKIMEWFTLTLGEMMFWRTFVIWGLIYFLYKMGVQNKYIIVAYISLYGICLVTLL